MRIRLKLLAWLMRPPLTATGVFLIVALPALILFIQRPLQSYEGWFWLFIVLHSQAVVAETGSMRSGPFAFLQGRGFTSDALWTHRMLASFLAVLCVWLPASVVIWLPIRSAILDRFLKSPYYPVFAGLDDPFPLRWLIGYLIFVPVFHYMWIRRRQPTRLPYAGDALVVGFLIAAVTAIQQSFFRGPLCDSLMAASGLAVALVLLVAGRLLHRTMEVSI
jgi:hypothetical protein